MLVGFGGEKGCGEFKIGFFTGLIVAVYSPAVFD
jgi:hypothetical protein